MAQIPGTASPQSADVTNAPHSPSHNGSTSSSAENTPRASAIRPGPTLWVEIWECQRWYPVFGWGTSRFLQDLPAFCCVPPPCRLCGAHPPEFDAALQAANPSISKHRSTLWQAQPVLTMRLPDGYRWVGFWEVYKAHPHGTDATGWRYGQQFFQTSKGNDIDATADHAPQRHKLAPFKKTQTPLCVVRRRLWRRRVALRGLEDRPLSDDDPLAESQQQLQSYLNEKQEEMDMAEHLKEEEWAAIEAGKPWSQEQEIRAEEELRKFCRDSHNRESASRMRSANPSFANPFRQTNDAYQFSPTASDIPNGLPEGPEAVRALRNGAAPASSMAQHGVSDDGVSSSVSMQTPSPGNPSGGDNGGSRDGAFTLQPSHAGAQYRVDGCDGEVQNPVKNFVASTPTDSGTVGAGGADVCVENTVDRFVATTSNEVANESTDERDVGVSIEGSADSTGAEFRSIFSQFMTLPEDQMS